MDSTRQSHIRQGIKAFKAISKSIKIPIIKTIGNTIKNSVSMFRQKKNAIKNLACGMQKQAKKQLRTTHKIGNTPIKHLGERMFHKYKVPQVARQGTKNIQMRSANQMSGKGLRPLVKRSTEQIRGKELGSLINMVSKSKTQVPFLFAGGLMRPTQFRLFSTNNKDGLDDQMRDNRDFINKQVGASDERAKTPENQVYVKAKKSEIANVTVESINKSSTFQWPDPANNLNTSVFTSNLHMRDMPGFKCLIYIHGTSGSKKSSQAQWLKKYAKASNIGYISFDLYGHGKSEQDSNKLVFSKWKEQVRNLIMTFINEKNAIIVAHSMGAGLTIKNAVDKDFMGKVAGLLLQAPDVDTMVKYVVPRMNEEQLGEMNTKGEVEFWRSETFLDRIRKEYIDDLRDNNNFTDVKKIKYDFPVSIIHSKNDDAIPYKSSEDLMDVLDCPSKKLTSLENSGHVQRDDATKKLLLEEQQHLLGQVDEIIGV